MSSEAGKKTAEKQRLLPADAARLPGQTADRALFLDYLDFIVQAHCVIELLPALSACIITMQSGCIPSRD